MAVGLQVAPAVTPKKGAFRPARGRRAATHVKHSQEDTMEVEDSEPQRTPGSKGIYAGPQSRRENSEGLNGHGGDMNGGGQFERELERLHAQFDTHKQYHPRGMPSALNSQPSTLHPPP